MIVYARTEALDGAVVVKPWGMFRFYDNLITAPSEGPGPNPDKPDQENCTGFLKFSPNSEVYIVQFVVFGN